MEKPTDQICKLLGSLTQDDIRRISQKFNSPSAENVKMLIEDIVLKTIRDRLDLDLKDESFLFDD